LCDACRKKAKQESVVRTRTCVQCHAEFLGGPSARYCLQCRLERTRAKDRAFKRNGAVRKLGNEYPCEKCGEPYVLNSGKQRYCLACSAEAIRENVLPKKRIYQKDYDPDHTKRKILKSGTRLCAICGKPIPDGRTTNTCSPECSKEQARITQNYADIRRGRRKSPADAHYDSGLPKSGVPGVTFRRGSKSKPWQVNYKGHYLGVYETIESATAALNKYKEGDNQHP
jgi:hypothetical protein